MRRSMSIGGISRVKRGARAPGGGLLVFFGGTLGVVWWAIAVFVYVGGLASSNYGFGPVAGWGCRCCYTSSTFASGVEPACLPSR